MRLAITMALVASAARTASADGDGQDPPAGPPALAPDEAATAPPPETIELDDRPPGTGRGKTTVSRQDLEERQPRSAPDALRWEPGVYVQQTGAAQGSAFVRGRTGQQTLLMFDGVRLNNGTWRQGPNQYFFTIDTRTLAAIDVSRGSASTRWGSDAIGGVLDAIPREPDPGERGIAPRLDLRWGSADHELGGRAEVAVKTWARGAALIGLGYRDVSLLESAGQVGTARGPQQALVPTFEADGRTQRGTGFREWAWDGRLVHQVDDDLRLTAAYYDYRQLDAPRTDQCPAPFAPLDECLIYDEQFHTMAYVAADARLGRWAETARLVLSVQEQHERRTRQRPRSFAENGGRDDVRTLGLAASARTAAAPLGATATHLEYGIDGYLDTVDSVAWLELTDLDYVRFDSRGQYVTGSRYATGGAFALATTRWRALTARAGLRAGLADAYAPGDAASATTAVDRTWLAPAGVLGVDWQATGALTLLATVDRSFRTPNLDDLTARQAAGPGFQFENAALTPERATTGELGARVQLSALSVEAWAYATRVDAAIARSVRSADDCPATAMDCRASWFRYQLVNLDGPATIRGAELAADGAHEDTSVRATLGYAFGEGPNPEQRPIDPDLPYRERMPLSRVPPLNGTVEVKHRGDRSSASLGLRWATRQDRLATSDLSDARIPSGGTPGYAVVDLRGGLRITPEAKLGVVLENLFDSAYRYHGSSINGPGRSLLVHLELTP